MRILVLLENDFRNDPRVEKEVVSLTAEDHTVVIAAITTSGSYSVESNGPVTIHRKPVSAFIRKSSVGSLKFPFYFNFWRNYVSGILEKDSFDIIHVHDLPLAQVGAEFRKSKKLKLVIDLHENWPALLEIAAHTNSFLGRLLSSGRQWRDYEVTSLGKADGIVTVVREMTDRLVSLGIDSKKIYVVENTPQIRDTDYEEKYKQEGPLKLIYVGGITYHRGLQFVLKGLSVLPTGLPVKLTVAGDGSYLGDLKKQADLLRINDIVEFTGLVSKEKATEMIRNSDIGLIPHIRSQQTDNSSPNKLYEYMASGIPVLASDCLSVKRIIEETSCGGTYEFDSPTDFAEKLQELNDPALLVRLSGNGIQAVQGKYNWDISVRALINLYKRLS